MGTRLPQHHDQGVGAGTRLSQCHDQGVRVGMRLSQCHDQGVGVGTRLSQHHDQGVLIYLFISIYLYRITNSARLFFNKLLCDYIQYIQYK